MSKKRNTRRRVIRRNEARRRKGARRYVKMAAKRQDWAAIMEATDGLV